jgi:hypothetical protein
LLTRSISFDEWKIIILQHIQSDHLLQFEIPSLFYSTSFDEFSKRVREFQTMISDVYSTNQIDTYNREIFFIENIILKKHRIRIINQEIFTIRFTHTCITKTSRKVIHQTPPRSLFQLVWYSIFMLVLMLNHPSCT